MSMNLKCYAVVDSEHTSASVDLIQTPTAVTWIILTNEGTVGIARAYLYWVEDNFTIDVFEAEVKRLSCVLANPDSFMFIAE